MSGGTKSHNRLALNLYSALVDRVDADGCEISVSDVKVELGKGFSYRYLDLIVSCDERDEGKALFYRFPKLIVEVLSPSTKTVDREDKMQEYIQIPTIEEYVLISAQQIQVECFRRGEGRMWLCSPYKAGEVVCIESGGVEFPIEQIYRNVRLES